MSSLHELYQKTKTNYNYSDFPVGTHVKVVVPCQDFNFFYGETGEVTKNTGGYLGIRVKFDEPRYFKDGSVQKSFNFKPCDLMPTQRTPILTTHELDFTKIKTLEDIINILRTIITFQIRVTKEHARQYGIEHLLAYSEFTGEDD